MDQQVSNEQNSFQALKNKWAQQAVKKEQLVSPPLIPPKPTSVILQPQRAHHIEQEELSQLEEKPAKEAEATKAATETAKKVSLLTQQFEKQKPDSVTPGNFSTGPLKNSLTTNNVITEKHQRLIPTANTTNNTTNLIQLKPVEAAINVQKATPLSSTSNVVSSPPSSHEDQSNHFNEEEFSSSGQDSDTEEDIYSCGEGSEDDGNGNGNGNSGDNDLIEQVQKAHLQYTKLEGSHFIGAPGVRSSNVILPSAATAENNEHTNKSLFTNNNFTTNSLNSAFTPTVSSTSLLKSPKKPPPPPPPSKKYHSTARSAPITQQLITQHPSPPSATIIPMAKSNTNELLPPVLPPRPIDSPLIPQLPPRPSQSTIARAHTIAATHSRINSFHISPTSTYTDSPNLSEYDEDFSRKNTSSSLKRSSTVSTASKQGMSSSRSLMTSSIYPDFSNVTRNAPLILLEKLFSTGHKASLTALAASKNLIITGSNYLRTWDAHTGTVMSTVTMDSTINQNSNDTDTIRAAVISPCRIPVDEGRYVWVARQDNELVIVDTRTSGHKILGKRHDVHAARINFLLRYGNSEVWSIDDTGVLNVWEVLSADYQGQLNPLLSLVPRKYRVTPHAVAATIYGSKLWMSSERTLAVHDIHIGSNNNNDTKPQLSERIPNDMGNITKLTTIPYHPYRIYASHNDGKISIWDTRSMKKLQVITVSMYGICTMASVGEYHVWAGYNTGMIYVYDTRPDQWKVLKMWKAHTGAVTQLVVDDSSLILDSIKGRLQVVSSDSNGFVGLWDGLLTEHWNDEHLHKRASEYCTYDDAKTMICSWNIDAKKPSEINEHDTIKVREWLGAMEDPDIIVVGIQEIVDLESKKQTVRSLFARKKDPSLEMDEGLTRRYKLWHDYLVEIIGKNYGPDSYKVIKTDQLVGLFSCVFVRTADFNRVIDVNSYTVKTGLKVMNKSIHGNKGGVAIRFVYDHTSLCFVNCHLAAGQSHTQQRNADAEGILQTTVFPRCDYTDVFTHGGDGAMITDHELCFLSGDLNYRIKMPRDDVLKLLMNSDNRAAAWNALQAEDQLLRQRIENPLFKLLQFEEAPICFDPTYKYDPGTSYYDRSEKRRVPAWCDRVLFKGKRIKSLHYRRHEVLCSDHRPISAGFSIQTKLVDQKKRDVLSSKVKEEWHEYIDRFIKDKKAKYVADYERCSLNEAFELLEKSDWDVNDTVIKLIGVTVEPQLSI